MSRKNIPKKKKNILFQQQESDRPLKPVKRKDKIKYRKPTSWLEEDDDDNEEDLLFYLKEEEE